MINNNARHQITGYKSADSTTVFISLFIHHDSIVFSVTDTGSGTFSEEINKVFKPFGKNSAKKTAREKSTGLGLAIIHKIITTQGKMQVDSTPGKGTIFTFTLPLKEEKINGRRDKNINSG